MRSDVSQFDLISPPTLEAALTMLAEAPGSHNPIAGGTELMVALNTGRLTQHSFFSIRHLREMRFIRVADDVIHIGACATFTDIRRSSVIAEHLPLLAQAASWTGSIANQNRGTLGGNICNASPAADSPPALLVYDATLTLASTRGQRTLSYSEFHLGYKKTAMLADELLHSISIPLKFSSYRQYIRKVGTRNAQAISKVALAGVARIDGNVIADIRLAAASLVDRPSRCLQTEAALKGQRITESTIRAARVALAAEAKPIDDIRSTARYRSAVAANLLEEFLHTLA